MHFQLLHGDQKCEVSEGDNQYLAQVSDTRPRMSDSSRMQDTKSQNTNTVLEQKTRKSSEGFEM